MSSLSVSSHRIELIATYDAQGRTLFNPYAFSILSSDRIDCNVSYIAVCGDEPLMLSVSSHRIELIATPHPEGVGWRSMGAFQYPLIGSNWLQRDLQSRNRSKKSKTFSILSSDRIDCNGRGSQIGQSPSPLSVSSHRIELIATLWPLRSVLVDRYLSVSSHRIELIATTMTRSEEPKRFSFSILSSDRIDCNAAHSFWHQSKWVAFQYPLIGSNWLQLSKTNERVSTRPSFSILSSDRIDCNKAHIWAPPWDSVSFSILSSDRIDCNSTWTVEQRGYGYFQYPLIGSNWLQHGQLPTSAILQVLLSVSSHRIELIATST